MIPPPGDPIHTQAMHYRRNQRGDWPGDTLGQRSEGEDAEKWDNVEEDKEGRPDRERAEGNSVGLFLQIVLLQTLAG